MKVYVLQSGDRQGDDAETILHGVFSSQEKAEAHQKSITDPSYIHFWVEEFEVDAPEVRKP